jgi:hypothetical protein
MVAWEEAYAPGQFKDSIFQVWPRTGAMELSAVLRNSSSGIRGPVTEKQDCGPVQHHRDYLASFSEAGGEPNGP